MENSLCHYGVLDMHWGIRRYQPYPKGKRVAGGIEVGQAKKVKQRSSSGGTTTKRSSSSSSNKSSTSSSTASKKTESNKTSESSKDTKDVGKAAVESASTKPVKSMTDEELRSRVNRLNLEKQYADLTKPPAKKENPTVKMLKDVGMTVTKRSLENVGTQVMTYAIGSAVNKVGRKYIDGLSHDIVKLYEGDSKKKKKGS